MLHHRLKQEEEELVHCRLLRDDVCSAIASDKGLWTGLEIEGRKLQQRENGRLCNVRTPRQTNSANSMTKLQTTSPSGAAEAGTVIPNLTTPNPTPCNWKPSSFESSSRILHLSRNSPNPQAQRPNTLPGVAKVP